MLRCDAPRWSGSFPGWPGCGVRNRAEIDVADDRSARMRQLGPQRLQPPGQRDRADVHVVIRAGHAHRISGGADRLRIGAAVLPEHQVLEVGAGRAQQVRSRRGLNPSAPARRAAARDRVTSCDERTTRSPAPPSPSGAGRTARPCSARRSLCAIREAGRLASAKHGRLARVPLC